MPAAICNKYTQTEMYRPGKTELYQCLVMITDALLACRDTEELARVVAGQLRRHFGVRRITLLFHLPFKGLNQLFTVDMSDANKPVCHSERTSQSLTARQGWLTVYLRSGHKTVGQLQFIPTERLTDLVPDESMVKQIAGRVAVVTDTLLSHYGECGSPSTRMPASAQPVGQTSRISSHDLITRSPRMLDVLRQMEIVARTNTTVLIAGETGTGKECLARAIHTMSERSRHRMVTLNCSAIPAGLLESELFGHERGAFTGAGRQYPGRFEQAHQGTLFLDEIGDMSPELQPKLLRVLQEQEFERIGGERPVKTDVRLIAATNRDLCGMMKEGTFRRDLYYRLNVFPLVLPPLRERPEDIPLLVQYFMQQFSLRFNRAVTGVSAGTLKALAAMEWPGNVRELQNVIERSVLMTEGSVLQIHALPETNLRIQEEEEDPYQQIIQALKATNGVVGGPRGAAQRLGVKRTTLLSRMKRLGIEPG